MVLELDCDGVVAEKFLETVEGNQNYLLLLLHLVDKSEVDMHLRVGAAITLKNFIKRNWKVVNTAYKLIPSKLKCSSQFLCILYILYTVGIKTHRHFLS